MDRKTSPHPCDQGAAEARRAYFDQLVAQWMLNTERPAFLAELRAVVAAELEFGSELAQWFDWAEQFIESTDVVGRFRPSERTLTLYYSGCACQ